SDLYRMIRQHQIGRRRARVLCNGYRHARRRVLPDVGFDRVQYLLGVLVGHKAARDLGVGFAGQYRLGALALEAAPHAVHFQRGSRPQPLQRRVARLAEGLGHADFRQELGFVERHPGQLFLLPGRQLPDVVVEAFDQDLTVGRAETGDDGRQRVQRILDGAAIAARVQVAFGALDVDLQGADAPAAHLDVGLLHPVEAAVGAQHRVAAQLLAARLEQAWPMVAASFLWSVDGWLVSCRRRAVHGISCVARLVEDECEAFVICRGPDGYAHYLHRRLEGRRNPPVLRIHRLPVEVAVDQIRGPLVV